MRLTESIRRDFVRRVLDDVPTPDHSSEARRLLQDDAYNQFPDKVKDIYDDTELRVFLHKEYIYVRQIDQVCIYCSNEYKRSIETSEAIKALGEVARLERQVREELQICLYKTISAFTTVKKAKDALPELAKYLPVEDTDSKSLPAVNVTEVVTQLINSGWK
jgi:hypothetical protein